MDKEDFKIRVMLKAHELQLIGQIDILNAIVQSCREIQVDVISLEAIENLVESLEQELKNLRTW